MEGKELHNEDDERKSGSESNKEESDDFGLPDASFGDESDKDKEQEEPEESSSNIYTTGPESESDFSSEEQQEDSPGTSQYSSGDDEEDGKKTPVGLIVFLSLIGVIAIAIAVYWFFFRTPKEVVEPVQTPPVVEDTTAVEPIIEEPEPEPVEEVVEEPPQMEEGTYQTITDRTGRYYIVLNSFFDEDLAMDYAQKMADEGVSTVILGAQDKKGFKRVALNQDFGGWTEAENRMSELKGTYGSEIWVLKY